MAFRLHARAEGPVQRQEDNSQAVLPHRRCKQGDSCRQVLSLGDGRVIPGCAVDGVPEPGPAEKDPGRQRQLLQGPPPRPRVCSPGGFPLLLSSLPSPREEQNRKILAHGTDAVSLGIGKPGEDDPRAAECVVGPVCRRIQQPPPQRTEGSPDRKAAFAPGAVQAGHEELPLCTEADAQVLPVQREAAGFPGPDHQLQQQVLPGAHRACGKEAGDTVFLQGWRDRGLRWGEEPGRAQRGRPACQLQGPQAP